MVQAAWLALSAVYPMPFDEYWHVGVIQIYAKQWSPFIAEQSAQASIYGDITREPSYIFHYLMSFPYRLLGLFTDNEMILIIALRLMNVALVVVALILFRRLLLKWGLSRRVTHVALLAFVATPMIPFLAAHVNYDNLMLLLAPLFLMSATRLITGNKDLVRNILLFGALGAATVLVKWTFLLLAVAVVLYVAVVFWRRNDRRIIDVLRKSWQQTPKGLSFVVLCLFFVLSAGLFVERFGGNIISYGAFRPDCADIQSREVCAEWGPWRRDNISMAEPPTEPTFGNPASFTQHWFVKIMSGFYVLFSHSADADPLPGDPYGGISGRGLLPLPVTIGYTALVAGLIAIMLRFKQIWRHPYLRFGLVISASFIAVEWLYNYTTYLNLGYAVAVQARYNYPILIIMFALMIQAGVWSIASNKIKTGLLVLFLALYVWGGGAAGWIVRAPDDWKWQNPTIQTVNHTARDVLRYLVIH